MRLKVQAELPERVEFPGRRDSKRSSQMVWDRYKDRARLAIAAGDRVRAKDHDVAAGQRRIDGPGMGRTGQNDQGRLS